MWQYVFDSQKAKCNGLNINDSNEQPCEQKVRDQTAQRKRQKSCICEIDRAWRTCLPSHADYHRQMTEAILDKLDEKELPVLIKTLDALSEFFNGYSEEPENK